MNELLSIAGGVLISIASTALTAWLVYLLWKRWRRRNHIAGLIAAHFQPTSIDDVVISERKFPYRVRADLQRAVDRLFDEHTVVSRFNGVRQAMSHEGLNLSDCLTINIYNPVSLVPPQYEEIDVGEEQPLRALLCGIWLLRRDGIRFVVLLSPATSYGRTSGVQFQIATANNEAGHEIVRQFFRHLEEAVLRAESYRGKILSLEHDEHSYSGQSSGIKVHRLRHVEREQIILPRATVELLDRNVLDFVRRRPELARAGQATKKGLLFYGPPGTGKTHTIHYLTRALPGHTTLLVTSEQVGLLDEYMTLARLLQPSVVVIEDADLIARDRGRMNSCEEVLLNKLLNEMDGLREQADILFILTTNRPEALERALSARPGRIDQAIEFPLPDDEGRAKLVRLYSAGAELSDELTAVIVSKTENVSAAFIKELMRRSVQFRLERDGAGPLIRDDVEAALNEMLFSGGSLNLKLLGAEGATAVGS
jgi:hypothetical protein